MTTPKFKEDGRTRANRLRLGKPHIFFCSVVGEWIRANAPACYDLPGSECAFEFCVDQDALARDLEAELYHRRAVEESEQKLAALVERLTSHCIIHDADCDRECGFGPCSCGLDDLLVESPTTSLRRRDAMVAADTCQALHDEFDCYKNDRDRLKVKTVRFVLSRWKGAFQRKAQEHS